MRRAEAGVTDMMSKPSPSIRRVISSPTLRRAATIRASATVPAENDDLGLGFQNPYAGIRLRFSKGDRHQRRSIDGNHRGKPSTPKRKSWLLAALVTATRIADPLLAQRSMDMDQCLVHVN